MNVDVDAITLNVWAVCLFRNIETDTLTQERARTNMFCTDNIRPTRRNNSLRDLRIGTYSIVPGHILVQAALLAQSDMKMTRKMQRTALSHALLRHPCVFIAHEQAPTALSAGSPHPAQCWC